jgi:TPR repeat protein
MRAIRIVAVTLAAIAIFTLSESDARAQLQASNDGAQASAPQPPSITLGVPKATVVETLVYVAESGNVDAMNLLGVLYTIGSEVPRDTTMALYWFQKAIDGGSADAMDNLATMYLIGIGLSRDPVNALRWFERSAARGNVHAGWSESAFRDEAVDALK